MQYLMLYRIYQVNLESKSIYADKAQRQINIFLRTLKNHREIFHAVY